MALTKLVINQIVIMLLLIVAGFICYKIGLITADVNKKLSSLVLKFVNPVLIFTSYQIEFKIEYLKGLTLTFVLAMISMLMSIFAAKIIIRDRKGYDTAVERFAIIYSNCGFMGIPLINSLFGAMGVFYLTAYITAFTLLVWTHGVILMKGERDSRFIKNVIMAPAVVAMVFGLIFFVVQVSLPSVLLSALKYIGDMNTPLAMITAGATIAQTKILKAFVKPRAYLVCLLRLLIVPVLTLLIFRPLNIDSTVLMTVTIAAACPTAATGTLFALNYGRDSLYASELFVVTTILSVATLPVVSLLFNLI